MPRPVISPELRSQAASVAQAAAQQGQGLEEAIRTQNRLGIIQAIVMLGMTIANQGGPLLQSGTAGKAALMEELLDATTGSDPYSFVPALPELTEQETEQMFDAVKPWISVSIARIAANPTPPPPPPPATATATGVKR